jgi:hypothetical protein
MMTLTQIIRSDGFKALGIGASCYLGLKNLKGKHTYSKHLGKALILSSVIATLYFSKLFEKNSYLSEWFGLNIPIPGLDGACIGINIDTLKSISARVSKVGSKRIEYFSKWWHGNL